MMRLSLRPLRSTISGTRTLALHRATPWSVWHGALLGLLVMGCGQGDTTAPPERDFSAALWHVRLNTHVILMSVAPPGNTFQLSATSTNSAGAVLVTDAPLRYTTVEGDTAIVVNPTTGLLTALYPTVSSVVTVRQTVGTTTLSDRVEVTVVDAMPASPLTTFALHTPGDSAKIAMKDGTFPKLAASVVVQDATGSTMTDASVHYWASAPAILGVGVIDNTGGTNIQSNPTLPSTTPMSLEGRRVGHTWLYAEATVFGVTKRDSVFLEVSHPLLGLVDFGLYTPLGTTTPVGFFNPETVTIATGGTVWFENATPAAVAIVFDDPTHVGAIDPNTAANFQGPPGTTWLYSGFYYYDGGTGNIAAFGGPIPPPPTPPGCLDEFGRPRCFWVPDRGRKFTAPGTYRYHNALGSGTGKIIVQ